MFSFFNAKLVPSLRIEVLWLEEKKTLIGVEKDFWNRSEANLWEKVSYKSQWNQYRKTSFLDFFVFAAYEAFFDKILWLRSKTGKADSSFGCLLNTTNLKIKP